MREQAESGQGLVQVERERQAEIVTVAMFEALTASQAVLRASHARPQWGQRG